MEKDEVKTNVTEINLRDIARGTVRFSIKADDTLENLHVHNAFKEYCKVETDNNYTQGLRKLLEFYETDYKFELMFNKIEELTVTVAELSASVSEIKSNPTEKVVEKEEQDDNYFGDDN